MILILVFGLLGIGSIAWAVRSRTKTRKAGGRYVYWSTNESVMTIVGCVSLVVFAVFSIWLAAGNMSGAGEVTKLQAFYEDTIGTYQYTIDRTENVVIIAREDLAGTITDFTYNGQGRAVSDRIAELRDRIAEYNQSLRYMVLANNWPIFGAFYYDVPTNLKPIKLGA